MTRYDQADVDAVKRATSMVALVSERVSLRRAGTKWVGLCPFHEERTPSLSVNEADGLFYCFGCRANGDAVAYLQTVEGLSYRDAVQALAARAGVTLHDAQAWPKGYRPPSSTPPARRHVEAPPGRDEAPADNAGRPTADEAARLLDAYVRSRGWPAGVVDRFDLEVVRLPWRDADGRWHDDDALAVRHPFHRRDDAGWYVAGWQDRRQRQAVNAGANKWHTTGRRLPLYNARDLHRLDVEAVVVCEGPADTITAAEALTAAGVPGLVAVGVAGAANWATEHTSAVLDALAGARRTWPGLVIVAADNDDAGLGLVDRVAAALDDHADEVGERRPHVAAVRSPGAGVDLTDRARRHGLAAGGEELWQVLDTFGVEVPAR